MEFNGKFNILFCIKIYFNSHIKINYENVDYNVKYDDLNDELELEINEWVEFSYVSLKYKCNITNNRFTIHRCQNKYRFLEMAYI